MGFVASESCGSFERSCQSLPVGPPPTPSPSRTHAGSWVYINSSSRDCHTNPNSWDAGKMPASQTGIGSFFLERNISMPTGYQIPLLGCPPGLQQQQAQHLAAMAAGIPITYSGLQGYNFIPYPHHRHIAHMVSPSFTK